MREDIFKKKHTYTADNLGKKCKHKKLTPPPPPPHHFSNGPCLITFISLFYTTVPWMIHLQHRQYSGQRKVKKGGPTFPEGAPEWGNCATC